MRHSIFATELCMRMEAGSPLRPSLHGLVAGHPAAANHQQKWELYRAACDLLVPSLHLAERGCWDFFDDDERALKDFDMWSKGMITEEGARTQPSGPSDPYRGTPRYLTFTMAFLLVQGTVAERAMAKLCEVPPPNLWRRDTFVHLLRGLRILNFAAVKADVVYLIPGDDGWGLTIDDLALPKFHYLRPLV